MFLFAKYNSMVHFTMRRAVKGYAMQRKYNPLDVDDCKFMGLLWATIMKGQKDVLSSLYMQNPANPFLCAVSRTNEKNIFELYIGEQYVKQIFVIDGNTSSIARELDDSEVARRKQSSLNLYNSAWYRYAKTIPSDEIVLIPSFVLLNNSLVSTNVFANAYVSHLNGSEINGIPDGIFQTVYDLYNMQRVLLPKEFQKKSEFFGRRLFVNDKGYVLLSTRTPVDVNGKRTLLHWYDPNINLVTREGIQHILSVFGVSTVKELFDTVPREVVHLTFDTSLHKHYLISFEVLKNPIPDYTTETVMILSIMERKSLLGLTPLIPYLSAIIVLIVLIGVIIIAVAFALCLAIPIDMVSEEMFALSRLKFPKPSMVTGGGIFTIVQPLEVRKMVDTLNQMKNYLKRFKLYLPMHIVRLLVCESQAQNPRTKHITVSFSDIVKFTTISNQLSAIELVQIMSEFYVLSTECVRQNSGWVIEILGDALFVAHGLEDETLRGGPGVLAAAHAHAAIRTCLQINKMLAIQNALWTKQGLPSIRIRHGIATGYVWCGCIGNNWRMQFTVLGDPVKKAHSLESFGNIVCDMDHWEKAILVDEKTVSALSADDDLMVRWIGPKDVPPMMQVYQILGQKSSTSSDVIELNEQLSKDCAQLSDLWEMREVDEFVARCKLLKEKWCNVGSYSKSFEHCLHEAEHFRMRMESERALRQVLQHKDDVENGNGVSLIDSPESSNDTTTDS